MSEYSIAIQPYGGSWTEIGTGILRGFRAENIQHSHALPGGPETLTFQLRRPAGQPWPDLKPFAKVHARRGARDLWSGRIIRTPTLRGADSVITVECEGHYQALFDNTIARRWVLNDMSEWTDFRKFGASSTQLATYDGTFQVDNNDTGQILFTVVKGVEAISGGRQGVTIDLGEDFTATKVVFQWQASFTTASFAVRVVNRPSDITASPIEDVSVATWTTTLTTTAHTITAPGRFLSIDAYHYAGSASTHGGTRWLRIVDIIVFGSSDYESGNASVLRASHVVSDVVERIGNGVSADTSLIESTSFDIPEFSTNGRQPYGEVIADVDKYHGNQLRLTREAQPRVQYRAAPTTPSYVVYNDERTQFEDTGNNDGSELFGNVVVVYEHPDGTPGETNVRQNTDTSLDFTNPSFATNTTGWSADGTPTATITRDTAVYNDSPASLRLTSGSAKHPGAATAGASTSSFSQSFIPGREYIVTGYAQRTGSTTAPLTFRVDGAEQGTYPLVANIFVPFEFTFTATNTSHELTFQLQGGPAATVFGYIDTLDVVSYDESFVSKQGITREAVIEVSSRITSTEATQLGEAFLEAHAEPPLKGTVTIQGWITEHRTGALIPVDDIQAGELILLADEIDPNTGAKGRQGVITGATYDETSNTATLEIDSSVSVWDAMLQRFGAA